MFNTSKSISVLGELEEVMIKNGDMFRSRAYARAGQVLMKYTKRKNLILESTFHKLAKSKERES